MAFPGSKSTPITFPHRFYADTLFRVGLTFFVLLGALEIGALIAHHKQELLPILVLLNIIFLIGDLFLLSLRIDIDSQGLQQQHLFGKTKVVWTQIARMEKSLRTYALYGDDGKELVMLSFIARSAHEAIAQEVIQQAGLQPSHQIVKYPVTEQWIRA